MHSSPAGFVLYVSGSSLRNARVEKDARALLSEHLGEAFELEVVDVATHPGLVEELHLMATPTLIRVDPPPEVRIVGDLANTQAVLRALGLGHPEKE